MNTENKTPINYNGNTIIATILIVAGVIFLLKPVFNIDIGHFTWPLFVIVPGVLILIAGLSLEVPRGEPVTVIGSVVTAVGLLLMFQNTTNQWANWAYSWALIAPTSIGLGLVLYGSIKGRPSSVNGGKALIKIGLGLFLAGAVFFELIIGISGYGLGNVGLPILLIALGVLLLFGNLRPAPKSP